MVTWTEEQKEAIEQTGTDILVAAAAGSGKTAVLVERIIQKVITKNNPINIDEILVATFTNAAAEEMRNRISTALEQAIAEDPSSYHLKKQLSLLQRASISTLHSFCTTVVRQYAYLLDLDPAFRIGDEMEMELLKQEVLDDMLEDYYGQAAEEELETFFTVVDMFSSDRNDVDVAQLILRLYTFAMENPWPEQWLQRVAATYDVKKEVPEDDIDWLNSLKKEVEEQLASFRHDIERAINIARESDGPYHYLEALESDLYQIDTALEQSHNWKKLQEYMVSSTLKSLSSKRVECNEDKKEAIKKIRQPFREQWNKWKKSWFRRNLTAHLEDMRTLYPAIKMVTKLVSDFKSRFAQVKREKALVDFSDLEHFCLQILISSESTEEQVIPSKIAYYYQNQFKEILVDEYQDINIVQETILSVVSNQEAQGNMFMVGDVKQSIYRFRHAEPTLFIDKYKQFEENPSKGYRIDLARNFRSREEVLTGANYLFRQIFDEALGEINYDPKAELIYGNLGYEDHPQRDPSIELMIIDREMREDDQANVENQESIEKTQLEARLYAQKINKWIGKDDKSALQIIDKETNQKRDIQYRDIVILQRSLTEAPTIVEELKQQGIPVHADLRTGYFVAIEIQVMINILKVIDNPYQDIPLASVLRSPIVGLDEEQLAQIRLAQQQAPYYTALQAYLRQTINHTSSLVENFIDQLEQFRALAKEGALSTLIWDIYRETGYYDFVGGIPGGKQRQANLRALYDRARGYETTSFRGLFRFLRFIENMQEQERDLGEARALSEQEDVVRIMTIHRSKGLEFPVVLIGGMTKEFNFRDIRSKYILDKDLGFATKFIDPAKRITYPTLYYIALQQSSLQKLLAEEMRVLYVAMTRAKEKLVMVGNVPSIDKEIDKWIHVLDHEQWVLPKQMRKNAKCYLDWVGPALLRHNNIHQMLPEEQAIPTIPAKIQFDESRWTMKNVSAMSLLHMDDATVDSTDNLQHIVEKWNGVLPRADGATKQLVDERLSFQYQFAEAGQTGAKQSVTEIKRRQEVGDDYSDKQIVRPFRAPLIKEPAFLQGEKELTAAEIGTAMHTVMQHIPLTKKWQREEINLFLEELVREEKLTKEEAEVTDVDAIEHFFKQEIADILIHSYKVEREVPFTYSLQASEVYKNWQSDVDEKVLIQGVADCIIHTDDGIIILDYKTDAIQEDVTDDVQKKLQERYRVQIELYERALSDILQTNIQKSYLYFFAKDLVIRM